MDRRIAGQGERCVLAVHRDGKQFGEVIATDAAHCHLLLPDGRESYCSRAELSEGVFTPVMATKIIKGDRTWVYYSDSQETGNTTWYSRWGIYV